MEHISSLFERDLQRLYDELEQMPEDILWEHRQGVKNSCGVLAQHITGNLDHFIGAVLGKTGYRRDREREFMNTGVPKKTLMEKVDQTREMTVRVLSELNDDELSASENSSFPKDYTPYQFIVHLYGHLNYHLGQFNYLRRILMENKA